MAQLVDKYVYMQVMYYTFGRFDALHQSFHVYYVYFLLKNGKAVY